MIGTRRHPRKLAGLGQTSVQALAEAQWSGQLSALQYESPMYQAPYGPIGTLTSAPPFLTAASAAQVAGLVGGSVVQCSQPYEGAPSANCVQVADGTFNPASIFPQGVILSYPNECAVEQMLVASIPGGQLSSTCAGGGTGATPSTPTAASNPLPMPTFTGSGGTTPSAAGYTVPNLVAPIIYPTPVSTSTQPKTNTTNTTNTTTQNTNPAGATNNGNESSGGSNTQSGSSGSSNNNTPSSTDFFTEDSLGFGLPNWAYAAIGLGGLVLVMEMGR